MWTGGYAVNPATRQEAAYGRTLAFLRKTVTDQAGVAATDAPQSRQRNAEVGTVILEQRALAAFPGPVVAVSHVLMGELVVPANEPAGLAAWVRLGVDMVLYCGLILAVGAVNVAQLRTMLGHLKSRRGGAPEPA